MTGKDMLKGIRNLDADLIEEAEFGKFQKNRAGISGKKKLLFLLSATLIMGTMTAAAVYTRWAPELGREGMGPGLCLHEGNRHRYCHRHKMRIPQIHNLPVPLPSKEGLLHAVRGPHRHVLQAGAEIWDEILSRSV